MPARGRSEKRGYNCCILKGAGERRQWRHHNIPVENVGFLRVGLSHTFNELLITTTEIGSQSLCPSGNTIPSTVLNANCISRVRFCSPNKLFYNYLVDIYTRTGWESVVSRCIMWVVLFELGTRAFDRDVLTSLLTREDTFMLVKHQATPQYQKQNVLSRRKQNN